MESLLSGAGNALSEVLYGTGELKGVKDAFLRGARTGAVMSGIENITDHVGSYGVAGSRLFGKTPNEAIIPEVTRRDETRRVCVARTILSTCPADWGMEEDTGTEEPTADQDTAG